MKFSKFAALAVSACLSGLALAAEPAPAAVNAAPAPVVTPPPALVEPAKIDDALRALVQSQAIVGVSALVYERGNEAYFGAFGLADRETN